jgi:hypothetical protein
MAEEEKIVRKAIPKELEAQILLECARRCALCFQLYLDLDEKVGQIAHLDHNPANNSKDNIAFLCLSHHSVYDSKTSQHKNFTELEVKEARQRLCELIARRSALLTEKGDDHSLPLREADRKTFESFLRTLPSNGGIERLREFNFAGWAFPWDWFADLKKFFYETKDAPDAEFLDPGLEVLRRQLLQSVGSFLGALSHHSYYLKGSSTHASIPEEWEDEQPGRFRAAVEEVHKAANETCLNYDAFVRAARKRLLA